MQTVGIKDLQVNPATLTKALEAHEYTIITKRSKPLSLALGISKIETMKLLSLSGVDVIDYDFKDELEDLDSFL